MKKNIFILISIVLAIAVIALVFCELCAAGLSAGEDSTRDTVDAPYHEARPEF